VSTSCPGAHLPTRGGGALSAAEQKKGLARYVRELVGDDGRRIADFMLSVLDDETERTETRIQAATWLRIAGSARRP
jgi:hypothetical protein